MRMGEVLYNVNKKYLGIKFYERQIIGKICI